MTTAPEKAALLRALHRGPVPLVLPNAWDCASARIFESLGFPAVATTSGGVAFSLGYPDGERVPWREMLAAVQRIARCVSVPVTADLEAGYSDITATAQELLKAGAVGLNIEDVAGERPDSLVPLAEQVERLKAVRRAGEHLVLNARTDIMLAQIGPENTRFDRAVERLKAYAEAGADCLFVPGVIDEQTIARFVDALPLPVNILAVAGSPAVDRLRALGVARISVGSGIARASMGMTRRAAQELQSSGTYSFMLEPAIPYAECNRLFEHGK